MTCLYQDRRVNGPVYNVHMFIRGIDFCIYFYDFLARLVNNQYIII